MTTTKLFTFNACTEVTVAQSAQTFRRALWTTFSNHLTITLYFSRKLIASGVSEIVGDILKGEIGSIYILLLSIRSDLFTTLLINKYQPCTVMYAKIPFIIIISDCDKHNGYVCDLLRCT